MPSDYEPVVEAGRSFFDRARKAVVGAATAGVTTALATIGTAIVADGFSPQAVVAGLGAGVVAALAGLKVVYEAQNKA